MSKTSRNIRVNELLRQELSLLLHTRYQAETVHLTVTEVDIAPDHRSARIYYTVIGDDATRATATHWLKRHGRSLQGQLARRVRLKQTPRLAFIEDVAVQRGNRILAILDEIAATEKPREQGPA